MSQTQTKWLADNAVNEDKARLSNTAYLRWRNAGDTADISALRVDSTNEVEFGVQPKFSGTPTANDHLANRGYVLDVIAGLRDLKDAVRAASTANIDLTTGGLLTIDGVSLSLDDRVLVKDQSTASENGIYLAKSGSWVRTSDADEDAEVTQGLAVDVVEGTVNGRTRWLLTTADPITVDTTSLTFVQIPAETATASFNTENLSLNATDISNGYVDLAQEAETGSVQVTPKGGPLQEQGIDYTLSVVASVTRVTFAGDLSTLLADGDKLLISYAYFA